MKDQIKKGAAILLCLMITHTVSGQEQLGLKISNYGGIYSNMLNPAANVDAPLRWDVNIIGGGAFAFNNYAYIENSSVLGLIKNQNQLSPSPEVFPDRPLEEAPLQYNFSNTTTKKEALVKAFATAPGAMFKIADHTFGIQLQLRTEGSINRIPGILNYYNLANNLNTNNIQLNKFKMGYLAWGELGINYGRTLFSTGSGDVNAGVTLKYLHVFNGGYFNNENNTSFYWGADSAYFSQVKAEAGYVNAPSDQLLKKNGWGVGMDLGVEYVIGNGSNGFNGVNSSPYKFKLGVSVLDIGRVRLTQNAQKHNFETTNAFDVVFSDYESLADQQAALQQASQDVYNSLQQSQTGTKFGMWTPAGISVQAEYAFNRFLYVNGTAVRRLRLPGGQVERDNILAITPRFEHRWFEAMVPVVLYNDKDLRVGTAVRLGFLTIGSDHVNSIFFKQKELQGSDIYFALKINPFSLGGNGRGKGGSFGMGKNKRKKNTCNTYAL